MDRTFFLISLPEHFEYKFNNFIQNLNSINNESSGIKIEETYHTKPKYIAVPKGNQDVRT